MPFQKHQRNPKTSNPSSTTESRRKRGGALKFLVAGSEELAIEAEVGGVFGRASSFTGFLLVFLECLIGFYRYFCSLPFFLFVFLLCLIGLSLGIYF